MFSLQLSPNEQKEFQDWRDKQYNEIVENVNKTAYERFKKETLLEPKPEKINKYIYTVKEKSRKIIIKIKSNSSEKFDDKFEIMRYPVCNYGDIIFDNEEEANKYIEKRKQQIKDDDFETFPFYEFSTDETLKTQHIFNIEKQLIQ